MRSLLLAAAQLLALTTVAGAALDPPPTCDNPTLPRVNALLANFSIELDLANRTADLPFNLGVATVGSLCIGELDFHRSSEGPGRNSLSLGLGGLNLAIAAPFTVTTPTLSGTVGINIEGLRVAVEFGIVPSGTGIIPAGITFENCTSSIQDPGVMSVSVDLPKTPLLEGLAINLIQNKLDGTLLCKLVANITERIDEMLAPDDSGRDSDAGPSQSVVLATSVAGVVLVTAAGLGYGRCAANKRSRQRVPVDEFDVVNDSPLLA